MPESRNKGKRSSPGNPGFPNRRSIRLKDFDYSGPGAYFVTVCTQNRACLFGEVEGGKMVLNGLGEAVAECWKWVEQQYAHVSQDTFGVMPNHLHGILTVSAGERRGGSRTAPTAARPKPKPLGRLVGASKTVSTKRINGLRDTPGKPVWQRNYHEHIVRNDADLRAIRLYIQDNPTRWALDEENPAARVHPVEHLRYQ